ncbi:hypothetical protein [Streptomyces caniscabiei]|uniref:Uncharacterized protein n=1 Tax=Streptomyces caniscabiei TaxID=2746961 RepID=A0ABU4MIM4_9ACTN|nr:hypothetical protein [Streptomyces caniscabiei]MBE4791041.1 hypothetical protein [Streptomyces caniscabiei]MDX3009670.1 hypothetical protein [Streptomyces caniscabiei]MDX3037315.1 hypothetical protein [Streptomyces caniscabiei]
MTKPKPKLRAPEQIPAAPRGLGGYCWAEHRKTYVHCTEPIGHEARNPEHYHAYSQTSWRD